MSASTLQTIPGVGPTIAEDLQDLGIQSVQDLQGKNPDDLYTHLRDLRGYPVDRCVLYVFRSAVYFANDGSDPDKLKWWNWKDSKRV